MKIKILILILFICALTVGYMAIYDLKLEPDSMRYTLVADEIKSGNGIRVPIIFFDRAYNKYNRDGTTPFLVQPPLYPILLSILGGYSANYLLAGKIINITSFFIVIVFTFFIVAKLQNNIKGLFAALAMIFAYPVSILNSWMLSDILFIAFTMLTIWSLIKGRDLEKYYIIAGLMAASAFATRYAGIVLILLFLWELTYKFFIQYYSDKKTRFNNIIYGLIIFLFIITTLILRNFIIAGNIRGLETLPVERSLYESFYGIFQVLLAHLSIWSFGMKFQLFGFLLIILLTGLYIHFRRKYNFTQLFNGFDIIVFFVISYFTFYIYIHCTSEPKFIFRFITPILPFIIIIIFYLIDKSIDGICSKSFNCYMKYSLMFLTIIYFSYNYFIQFDKIYYDYFNKINESFYNSKLYNYIDTNLDKRTIITTNKPQRLSYYGTYSTMMLPKLHWNHVIPSNMHNELPSRMKSINSNYLALFNHRGNILKSRYGTYIYKLSNQNAHQKDFILIYSSNDGVLYKLKP
jgi:hypothetical protein